MARSVFCDEFVAISQRLFPQAKSMVARSPWLLQNVPRAVIQAFHMELGGFLTLLKEFSIINQPLGIPPMFLDVICFSFNNIVSTVDCLLFFLLFFVYSFYMV